MINPRNTLAKNIKRIRSERELSQAALSVISETRLPGISELENAKGNPTLDTLIAVAKALKVTVSDLFN